MFVVFAALLGDAPEPSVDELQVRRWVDAARRGDGEAARRLYSQHVGRVFRAVRGLCHSEADAEDVAQETFATALRRLDAYRYRPETRFVAWLCTVGLNLARKRLRTERRAEAAGLRESAAGVERMAAAGPADRSDAVASPEDALLLAQRRERLLAALAELPERDRAVVSLRYGAGLSAPEVAEALSLTSANVRKICERQRGFLEERLTDEI